jgi:glyoxylase-like metal-dependent hydrolase (beta-lactamase superfamily II)
MAVDAGASPAAGRALLDAIQRTAGKPVKYLVVTHAHADHAGGAAVFAAAGAQVICAESAAPGVVAVLRGTAATGAAAKPATPPPGAARGVMTVAERLLLVGGPRRVEIYYLGPAHTRGDLVVALPEEKVLFGGDLAANGVIPYVRAADADPVSWERLLPRLAALRFDRLVPGHGEIGPIQGLSDTLAYLHRANEIANKLVAANVSEAEADRAFYAPENVIENVRVSPEHIANMKAVYEFAKARARATTPTPATTPMVSPRP